MGKLFDIVHQMNPKTALTEMAEAVTSLLPLLDEDTRRDFILDLMGEPGGDKVSSMVHL